MNKKLLIIGATPLGRICRETAEAMDCFEKIDFLDDSAEGAVGNLNDYEALSAKYSYAFAAFEDAVLRKEWMNKLEAACYTLAVLAHPKAMVSPSTQLQKNVLVCPGAVVNTGSVVCQGTVLSAGAIVDHDCLVGEMSFLKAGAIVVPCTVVPEGTTLCEGQVYRTVQMAPDYSFEAGM